MLRFVVGVGLSLVASGCMPKTGRLEINRFQHEEFPYAVFYAPEGSPVRPLGGEWQVDNFWVQPGPNGYLPKDGAEYISERRYDTDGNGEPETIAREPFYDLLLDHTQKDASLFVRTVPMAAKDKDKDLAVFAERYVEAVAGAGSIAVRFGAEGPVGSIERRYASRVLHSQTCTVSKREAYRVDFEVANVDQLQLSDRTRWKRGSVVLVRTGYGHRVRPAAGAGHADYPVLMLIGLAASPQDFASLEGDFERLLKQTVLGEVGKGLSMNGETTCALSKTDANDTSGGEAAPEAPELNEASQVPLAPEAMPQPEATPPSTP